MASSATKAASAETAAASRGAPDAADAPGAAPRAVIGLEIHCQMTGLKSKLFCTCRSDYRGMPPNENICPVCAGLPGALPLLNRGAVVAGAMIATALGCSVPERVMFFRKNYFYPDLPKNFQITQLDTHGEAGSIGGSGGKMTVDGKTIRVRRVQLEEDPGRIIYAGASAQSRVPIVDYNRAGTALVEIVTEPDFENPRQVRVFLQALSDVLENLGVSNPALEGAMRADANVSLEGGSRVEIKNVSSFHDIEKAVVFEIARQGAQRARGHDIAQETRHWDAGRKITVSARSKEADMDYRYLPESDIPWVVLNQEFREGLAGKMPEGVEQRRARYVSEYGMPPQVAAVLSSEKAYSDLFDAARTEENSRDLANIITTDLMGIEGAGPRQDGGSNSSSSSGGNGGDDAAASGTGPARASVPPDQMRRLADAVSSKTLSRNSAKQVLHEMVKTSKTFDDAVSGMDAGSISDASHLEGVVSDVISEEGEAVQQAASNPATINYLVGKVMQKTRGRADPQMTLDLLRQHLRGK